MTTHFNVTWFWFPLEMQTIASSTNKLECVSFLINLYANVISVICASFYVFMCAWTLFGDHSDQRGGKQATLKNNGLGA